MKTVLIGMPSYSGMIPSNMVQSILQLHKPLPCAFMVVDRQRIDKSRNAMALECLQKGADYLFFIDDDNPIPPDTLDVFLKDDKDIVTAPILSRTPNKDGEHNLCSFYAKEKKVDGKKLKLYYPIKKLSGKGPLHKVDATGTGCLLIKRKVLEKLYSIHRDNIFEFGDIRFSKKYTFDGIEYDRRTMSEDCEFSERATNAGFEIWLDERIRPFHITSYNLIQWSK